MYFNYQQYVQRFSYDPYQWPPDISLAQLHSRVSEGGTSLENPLKCPCCDVQLKKKYRSWHKRSVTQDCQKLGSSIPAYFGLMKYFISAIFVIILVNGIYPLWATSYACNNIYPHFFCLDVGVVYYIDYNILVEKLIKNDNNSIVDVLTILRTISYYLLIGVNLGILWYLNGLRQTEQKVDPQLSNSNRRSEIALILHNAPTTDFDELKKIILKGSEQISIQITDVIPLTSSKKYSQLFNKRNSAYYSLLAEHVHCQDPKKKKKKNTKLKILNQELHLRKKQMDDAPNHNVIILFKRALMAKDVYERYRMSYFRKILFGFEQLAVELKIKKTPLDMPYHTTHIPLVRQIKWQNAGQPFKQKLSARIKSFFLALIIIVVCLFLLVQPMNLSLSVKTEKTSSDSSDLTIFQSLLPIFISVILVVISILYRQYMFKVAQKRNPLNQFEASKFVLWSSMLFHIFFYVLIPTGFFYFNIASKVQSAVKLYVIASQARTFIIIQCIISVIDVPYNIWKSRKVKALSDQRQCFKFNQKTLHKIVEYRDFPLEIRLQVMFRMWSFVMFYTFYVPEMLFYILIAMIILFYIEKRNFYMHYTLRRSISLRLQINFMKIFIIFILIFQCLVYSYLCEFNWMFQSAIPITFTLLIMNMIYWGCFHDKRVSQKENIVHKQIDLKASLIRKQSLIDPQLKEAFQVALEFRKSYQHFLKDMKNDKLEQEIETYLKEAEFQETSDLQSVLRTIELSQSQFDEND